MKITRILLLLLLASLLTSATGCFFRGPGYRREPGRHGEGHHRGHGDHHGDHNGHGGPGW